MWESFKNHKNLKELMMKAIVILILAAVALLSLEIITNNTDERKQIIDEDGGTEAALCSILTDIKGAGQVDVMIQYNDEAQVCGVIVTAEGANSVVVRNDLTRAVAAVFDIPLSNVVVFEKENGGV